MARKRASSIQQAIDYASNPPADHHLSPQTTLTANRKQAGKAQVGPTAPSQSFWDDLTTVRWMVNPISSLKMIVAIVSTWAAYSIVLPNHFNPLTPFVKISYPLSRTLGESETRYGKGPLDVCFLAFYVIVFSFLRQSITIWVLQPLARWHGLKTEAKQLRFMEQAYTCLYFTVFGSVGVWIMSGLPTWWYKTEYFWIDYPHWRMLPSLKVYYLLQFSYWLQQMLVLVLRIEKPRSDFVELVVHHIVTLWLVGWSYSINLTFIGVSIFVTMDVSDIFLALSKCLNYISYQRSSEIVFTTLLCAWTYFRHYLNLKILWSIWTEWDALIPAEARFFEPSQGVWMIWWMKWQIFTPILLLQFVNLFWYMLIWRVIYRILTTSNAKDVREEGEDEEEEEEVAKKEQ